MDIGFGWLGVGVGLAGCLATFSWRLLPSDLGRRLGVPGSRPVSRFFSPSSSGRLRCSRRPPFSEGQTLGLGFLIGGITGAAAILLSSRLVSAQVRTKSLAAHSIAFLALFGVSLTYSIFHGNPQDAMIYEGKEALSINAFMYRECGVMIAYLLCGQCGEKLMAKPPTKPTSMHKAIEENLASAYLAHVNSLT